MEIVRLFIQTLMLAEMCTCWEYCQKDVQQQLCGAQTHFVCDLENSVAKPSKKSLNFLAHVPLTRKVKKSFLNWHNYYRNRTAGGWVHNDKKVYFPKAVRMRELIWDSELSYLAHVRTKLMSAGDVDCASTLRFPSVRQNLVVEAANESQPVLKVIALALKKMFATKNFVQDPHEMPKNFLDDHRKASQFIIMIHDRVSRLGCAVALASDCEEENGNIYKYCYYTGCSYDGDIEGMIYKIGKPTGRCSYWEVGRSKTYLNLCANSGRIIEPDDYLILIINLYSLRVLSFY